MKKMIFLAALVLAGCGVDGEPVQPAGGVNVSLTGNGIGQGANVGLKSEQVQGGSGT